MLYCINIKILKKGPTRAHGCEMERHSNLPLLGAACKEARIGTASGKFRLFLLDRVTPVHMQHSRVQYSCSRQALIDPLVRTANLQTVLEHGSDSSIALNGPDYEAPFVRKLLLALPHIVK